MFLRLAWNLQVTWMCLRHSYRPYSTLARVNGPDHTAICMKPLSSRRTRLKRFVVFLCIFEYYNYIFFILMNVHEATGSLMNIILWISCMLFTLINTLFCGGGLYWIRFVASVRPSVCPSVCPSVSNSCLLYNSFTNERISFKLEWHIHLN